MVRGVLLVLLIACTAVQACPAGGTPPADILDKYNGAMELSPMIKSMLAMKKIVIPDTPTIPITIAISDNAGKIHIDSPQLATFTLSGALTWCAEAGTLDIKLDEEGAKGLPANPVRARFQVTSSAAGTAQMIVDMIMPAYPEKFVLDGAKLLVHLTKPVVEKKAEPTPPPPTTPTDMKKEEPKPLTPTTPTTPTTTTTTTTPPKKEETPPAPPAPHAPITTPPPTTTTAMPKPEVKTPPSYKPVTPAPGSPPTQKTAAPAPTTTTTTTSTGNQTAPSNSTGCLSCDTSSNSLPVPKGWMLPIVVGKLSGPATPVIMPTCDCEGESCPHGCSPLQTASSCGDCSDVTLYHCASTCVTKSAHTTPCLSDDHSCFSNVVRKHTSKTFHHRHTNRKDADEQQVIMTTVMTSA